MTGQRATAAPAAAFATAVAAALAAAILGAAGAAWADARADTVASGLSHPWAVAFVDGRHLVTERPGRMRIVEAGGQLGPALDGVPAVAAGGQGGPRPWPGPGWRPTGRGWRTCG